jgi:GT2 family glycosyltransferase
MLVPHPEAAGRDGPNAGEHGLSGSCPVAIGLEGRKLTATAVDIEPEDFSPTLSATLGAANGFVARPSRIGKFLSVGADRFYVRGVTYGAFRPNAGGEEYHDLDIVDRDFRLMAASGFNTVRIPHTMPPRSLLDVAERHGLRVMVGLSAEQYVGYLTDTRRAPDIESLVRAKVRTVAGHRALLCYALGNEIPASTARWLGRRRVEHYLERLYRVVKVEDSDGLVTYVNYPSTEYLQLPFLDLVCFNVYLENPKQLRSYLARLQNLSGGRPLVMSEVGLDALRHGEPKQAEVLDWQVREVFAAGCAGVVLFSWTDEWFRAGADVDDWRFGLTDWNRNPKPALSAVMAAFADVPFPIHGRWPPVSVVVCSHNGARTISECLQGLRKVRYPDFEVIVIDDGSTDETAAIASRFGARVIQTPNRGLSSARNTGLEAATGVIVAYLDDDAWPDPDWLLHLVTALSQDGCAGAGGPNLPPAGDGTIADCVANAPGGPSHVLLSDHVAEHVPGCNLAVWKESLQAIGGFDPQFRAAGDDVDICWRLQQNGWQLAFAPAAVVWHHRRNSLRGYWRQQVGYGRADALLQNKWPDKYNPSGRPMWGGRIYTGASRMLGRSRVYHGSWCAAPFQSLYQSHQSGVWSLPLTPAWYLMQLVLAGLAVIDTIWSPLLFAIPILTLAIGLTIAGAVRNSLAAVFPDPPSSGPRRLRALTTLLHLVYPAARLWAEFRWQTAMHRRRRLRLAPIWPRRGALWTRKAEPLTGTLSAIAGALRRAGVRARRGGDYDRWDLAADVAVASARLLMDVEEHGLGQRLVRFRLWPRWSLGAGLVVVGLGLASIAAMADGAWAVAAMFGVACAVLLANCVTDAMDAMAAMAAAIEQSVTARD